MQHDRKGSAGIQPADTNHRLTRLRRCLLLRLVLWQVSTVRYRGLPTSSVLDRCRRTRLCRQGLNDTESTESLLPLSLQFTWPRDMVECLSTMSVSIWTSAWQGVHRQLGLHAVQGCSSSQCSTKTTGLSCKFNNLFWEHFYCHLDISFRAWTILLAKFHGTEVVTTVPRPHLAHERITGYNDQIALATRVEVCSTSSSTSYVATLCVAVMMVVTNWTCVCSWSRNSAHKSSYNQN